MSERFLLKELSRYRTGTFAHIIYRNALLHPNKEGFVHGNTRTTYAEYNRRVNQLVNALRRMGLKKGDVLGILSWNSLQFAEFYGATMKGGFIASPFNPRLTPEEYRYVIDYSEAKALLLGPELIEMGFSLRPHLPKIRHFIALETDTPGMTDYQKLLESDSGEEPGTEIDEHDPACIIYTSGTTGTPRGALYTQRRLTEDAKTLLIDTGIQPGDRHLQITPLFHIAGYTWFRAFLYIGGCNVILKGFDPAATLKSIQAEKITHLNFVPTQLVAMLGVPGLEKHDLSSIKFMWYGASPMPLEVLKKASGLLGPIFAEGYGQSESGPAIAHLSREEHHILSQSNNGHRRRLSSAGQPDISVQVRIVDVDGKDVKPDEVGEIIVRSEHMMQEYWNKPEETERALVDGWLYTGDMGTYDDEGFIYIMDRKKDMIISGGENIYPREVEEVLYRHPAVLEAAVIGIPDDYWVERVHAVVVKNEQARVTAEEIIAFCRSNMASYKAPKSVEFVESLPKNPSGKILKRLLRDRYWQKQPAAQSA
jgi:acyl-CoA synthetase (AMP-forming)/AMP-acid ligase II